MGTRASPLGLLMRLRRPLFHSEKRWRPRSRLSSLRSALMPGHELYPPTSFTTFFPLQVSSVTPNNLSILSVLCYENRWGVFRRQLSMQRRYFSFSTSRLILRFSHQRCAAVHADDATVAHHHDVDMMASVKQQGRTANGSTASRDVGEEGRVPMRAKNNTHKKQLQHSNAERQRLPNPKGVTGSSIAASAAVEQQRRCIQRVMYKSFRTTIRSGAEFHSRFGCLTFQHTVTPPHHPPPLPIVAVAGRVAAARWAGNSLGFLTIRSDGVDIQVVFQKKKVDKETILSDSNAPLSSYEPKEHEVTSDMIKGVKHVIGVGDVIGVCGYPGRTKSGELSLFALPLVPSDIDHFTTPEMSLEGKGDEVFLDDKGSPRSETTAFMPSPCLVQLLAPYCSVDFPLCPDQMGKGNMILQQQQQQQVASNHDRHRLKKDNKKNRHASNRAKHDEEAADDKRAHSSVSSNVNALQSYGSTNCELRYRYRFLDMIANAHVSLVFRQRHEILRQIRHFFDDRGFVEVETPMFHPVAGGAAAKPFCARHEATSADVFLRIAPELYLKKCVVGGLHRVYEIGKVFRNEGMDRTHNPEFTSVEMYQAFASVKEDLIPMTQQFLRHMAISVNRFRATRQREKQAVKALKQMYLISSCEGSEAVIHGTDRKNPLVEDVDANIWVPATSRVNEGSRMDVDVDGSSSNLSVTSTPSPDGWVCIDFGAFPYALVEVIPTLEQRIGEADRKIGYDETAAASQENTLKESTTQCRKPNTNDSQQKKFTSLLRPVHLLDTPEGVERLLAIFHRHPEKLKKKIPLVKTAAKLLDKLIDVFITDHIVQPTFVTGHPCFMSPLAREVATSSTPESRSGIADRFELFVNGTELINAYGELADPAVQYENFRRQAELKIMCGDEEALSIDDTFLGALQVGLPPTAGWGLGIDRLVMFLTATTNHHFRAPLQSVSSTSSSFPATHPHQHHDRMTSAVDAQAGQLDTVDTNANCDETASNNTAKDTTLVPPPPLLLSIRDSILFPMCKPDLESHDNKKRSRVAASFMSMQAASSSSFTISVEDNAEDTHHSGADLGDAVQGSSAAIVSVAISSSSSSRSVPFVNRVEGNNQSPPQNIVGEHQRRTDVSAGVPPHTVSTTSSLSSTASNFDPALMLFCLSALEAEIAKRRRMMVAVTASGAAAFDADGARSVGVPSQPDLDPQTKEHVVVKAESSGSQPLHAGVDTARTTAPAPSLNAAFSDSHPDVISVGPQQITAKEGQRSVTRGLTTIAGTPGSLPPHPTSDHSNAKGEIAHDDDDILLQRCFVPLRQLKQMLTAFKNSRSSRKNSSNSKRSPRQNPHHHTKDQPTTTTTTVTSTKKTITTTTTQQRVKDSLLHLATASKGLEPSSNRHVDHITTTTTSTSSPPSSLSSNSSSHDSSSVVQLDGASSIGVREQSLISSLQRPLDKHASAGRTKIMTTTTTTTTTTTEEEQQTTTQRTEWICHIVNRHSNAVNAEQEVGQHLGLHSRTSLSRGFRTTLGNGRDLLQRVYRNVSSSLSSAMSFGPTSSAASDVATKEKSIESKTLHKAGFTSEPQNGAKTKQGPDKKQKN